jgi:hypothetical protein
MFFAHFKKFVGAVWWSEGMSYLICFVCLSNLYNNTGNFATAPQVLVMGNELLPRTLNKLKEYWRDFGHWEQAYTIMPCKCGVLVRNFCSSNYRIDIDWRVVSSQSLSALINKTILTLSNVPTVAVDFRMKCVTGPPNITRRREVSYVRCLEIK